MFENNQTNSKNSNRGGKRTGAGRKAGAATKKTRAIADKAAAEGITPLEVMLRTMRTLLEFSGMEAFPPEERLKMMLEASAVAKDAAPYVHPRLQAIEHSGGIEVRSAEQELAEMDEIEPPAEGS
jgi:hypothetical protein